MLQKMLDFLFASPTAFQAVEQIRNELVAHGYQELVETKTFDLERGGKYFVCRNGSSIIAFNIGKKVKEGSFKIVSSHLDCPSFKLKPNLLIKDGRYVKLNTEPYGGPLYYPWFDRPLSIAGRAIIETENGVRWQNFNVDKDLCLIPSTAIHMNREVNKGYAFNQQTDLLPIIGIDQDFDIRALLGKEVGVDKEQIVGFDAFLYPRVKGMIWGDDDCFVSSHHLDDLESGFTTFMGFIDNFNDYDVNIYAGFDNEETGSLSRQGADSDFMELTLQKIGEGLGFRYEEALARSMYLSTDNAHAVHPAHPEKSDPTNRCEMNKGIVIKFNANQSYTSDALSMNVLTHILKKENIPYQVFTNRSDMRGGGTLGNISNRHASLMSVDIGLAQLAMHSCYETAGSKDVQYMIDGVKAFMASHIEFDGHNSFAIEKQQ
ncbi:MAG: M18 family aminopeptidase [Erysipelotrichaceae bacterium]|nr:M18 family aminopeptidase [Erysipelotrichaceae bacterium]